MRQTPWWNEKDKTERAKRVVDTVGTLARDQEWRLGVLLRRLSVYHGREITSLDSIRSGKPADLDDRQFPFAMSVIDTAEAKIAAKQRPIPRVLTQGASYKTRLQARKISKFLVGQCHQPQGQYPTLWALTRQVFCDAMIGDAGCVKIRANVSDERVDVDRVFAHEVFFDDYDAEYGNPTQLYHRYRYDRYRLAEMFPEHEEAILEAKLETEYGRTTLSMRDTQLVTVYEAYRLRLGKKTPGRHCLAIQGPHGEVLLVDEEYKRNTFPYVFIQWKQRPVGMWGMPVTDQVELAQDEANLTLERIRDNVRLGAGGYVDLEANAYSDEGQIAALESNASLKLLTRNAGTQPAQITMPEPYNPLVGQHAERMRELVNELPGVSELAAQGRKEPGITSGVAIRESNDLQGERFLPKAQNYEQAHVDIGKRILEAVQDLADAGVAPTSYLPSEGLITSIDWNSIKPGEDDLYEVTIQPANSLSDSVAARKQFIADMQASGLITPEVAARMLASDDPDIEGENARKTGQYNWLERIICQVLDVDDDEADIDIEGPDPLMKLDAALMQMTEAYIEVSSWEGTPENKRAALRNWVLECSRMMATANPPAPPAPPGMPPGMPQGPPPMGAMPPPGV